MSTVPVRNEAGEVIGEIPLDLDAIAPPVNRQLLHDAVVMYEANRRVGTVQTKSRGMVEGSTRKLYRQKGTGRARAGMRRTPVRRGGGHTFGKKPRDFGYRLPKKALRLATRMALRSKFEDEQAVVLDAFSLQAPRTSHVAKVLAALGLAGASCLIVTDGYTPLVYKSARNIPGVAVLPDKDLNAYALLRHRNVLLLRPAIEKLAAVQQAAAG
ncbi:MAG: 50S ribosomal protein L4 [Planctomycetota bacterium]|nr:MAG: 50S ribosomal protein L4 [Planctomycetota bacterium]